MALGGALGACTRYLADAAIGARLGAGFPWGTFLVNVSGCFLIGVVAVLIWGGVVPAWTRPLLVVGFLGGYTTFSTYSNDTLELLQGGEPLLAVANALGQVVLGLVGVYLGMVVARGLAG